MDPRSKPGLRTRSPAGRIRRNHTPRNGPERISQKPEYANFGELRYGEVHAEVKVCIAPPRSARAAGEAALFYSDGLVEAHDPRGQMFGFPRLRALIAEHGEERSLGDFLMEELYSFVEEGWEQEDDITLLTLRRSASLS
jgi:hypothetical protein